MTPVVLHQLWALVDETHYSTLIHLDDNSLVQWLLKQLRQGRSLNHDEADSISSYIRDRLPLIREMAEGS